MVGVQGPQAQGAPGWGAPSAAPSPQGGSGEKVLIALASVVAVIALVGGSVFVVGQRGDESSGPDTTDPDTTDPDTTDPDTTDPETTDPETTDPGTLGPPDTYDSYSTVIDDEGFIEVSLPDEWSDRTTAGIEVDSDTGETTPGVRASTDIAEFVAGYTASGAEIVIYGATTLESLAQLYDDQCLSDLPPEDVTTVADGLEGQFILFSECTGTDDIEGDGFAYVAAFDLPDGNTLSIAVVIAVEADFEAVGAIIDTVEVVA